MKEGRSRGIFSNLHANMHIIEERISQIEITSEMCHKPRGLSELKHWKGNYHIMLQMHVYWCIAASEFRSWVLFYAIPVMNGILDDGYLRHYMLFSEGLWLLLQSSVSLSEVNEAEMLLQQFCLEFAGYYGMQIQ